VLESGEIRVTGGGRRTYFLGCWDAATESRWAEERAS
jgi:hypothetical protein